MGATRRVKFRSGQIELEGVLHDPVSGPLKAVPERAEQTTAAVICHPHPLYGGTMHNNVVLAVTGELASRGWTVLRFNFRGVGSSQGSYGGAERARDDAAAALSFLVEALPQSHSTLAMVGYSFGAWAALAAGTADARASALVGISPAIPSSDYTFLRECSKPKLFVYGQSDEYANQAAVTTLLESLPEPKGQLVFPGADHFWWQQEQEMAVAVADFLDRAAAA